MSGIIRKFLVSNSEKDYFLKKAEQRVKSQRVRLDCDIF